MNLPQSKLRQREKLKILLTEALDRGLTLPPEVVASLQGNDAFKAFPKTPDGYYYKRDGRPFVANDKQAEFIHSGSRFVLLNSARGGGKSASGAQKALAKIEQGQSGMVLNPDFENFKISTWQEFREWIPWNMVVPKHRRMASDAWVPTQPFQIVFTNGAKVICKGLKSPDSARGPNVNWLWFDEVGNSDMEGLSWRLAIASVRIGVNPQCWATGTPAGKDHWVYKFFIERDFPEDVLRMFEEMHLTDEQLIHVVHTTLDANKDNLDPMFYASLMAAYPPGWLREQELKGEFVERGTVLGDPSWFDGQIINNPPSDAKRRVRFWDMAATEKKIVKKKLTDPDHTIGTLMSWDKTNFYIEDQVGGQLIWEKIKELIYKTALMDGPYVEIWIEEEPGSGGINQVAEIASFLSKELPGWPMVKGWKPEGDKVMRANVWFAEASQKKFFLVNGVWVKGFLSQLSSFPVGVHDDRIDSVSGARHIIAPIRMWRKIPFLSLNRKPDEERSENG